ncbi:hypothetical protein MRB53_041504 [Persea americana]|nr:hypothetical protein MRB53_041504 [Persea americana]
MYVRKVCVFSRLSCSTSSSSAPSRTTCQVSGRDPSQSILGRSVTAISPSHLRTMMQSLRAANHMMVSDKNQMDFGLSRVFNLFSDRVKGHIVAIIGELVGTFFFLLLAFSGTQTANVSSNNNTGDNVNAMTAQKTPQQLLYISLAFGFSLAAMAGVFARISGGLFNPAVTLGMVLILKISWLRGIFLFIAQMAGAIAAAFVTEALFSGALNVGTTLQATTSVAQGVFWTGGSLNPARSFAPSVATQSFQTIQWVYWAGPLAGSVLAWLLYVLVKALEYETVNPEPDQHVATTNGDGRVRQTRSGDDIEMGNNDANLACDRSMLRIRRSECNLPSEKRIGKRRHLLPYLPKRSYLPPSSARPNHSVTAW